MSTKQETTKEVAVVDLPQPAPLLSPEAVVEQLRAMRSQIGEVSPLTPAQRKTLRTKGARPTLFCRHRSTSSVLWTSLSSGRPAGRRNASVVRRGQPLDGGGG
ncbi:MAG TPA: hypothetical protein VN380_09670 [Thermoanaerobaculia bacterium]|nr:hypothetical protein [Thermoanaerobaculia bacterium]